MSDNLCVHPGHLTPDELSDEQVVLFAPKAAHHSKQANSICQQSYNFVAFLQLCRGQSSDWGLQYGKIQGGEMTNN